MVITEMISHLEEIKSEYGDIPILLADRYAHYEIKWIDCSNDHICIRMQDNIKYDDN